MLASVRFDVGHGGFRMDFKGDVRDVKFVVFEMLKTADDI